MKKVLVVDDKYYVRIKLRNLLEKENFHVVEAANGLEAICQYELERPDIVLLDIIMPEMDGITALPRIVALDSDARVVMVSSLSEKTIVAECLEQGAKEYITKPFEDSHILNAVNQFAK